MRALPATRSARCAWSRGLAVSSIALSISLLASSCGGDDEASSATTHGAASTTTQAELPRAPLTGLPTSDPSVLGRPALVAKIDNSGPARPQTGINQADIVFEENIEGASRFAAVFHSTGSDPVGPLRSGRTQDIDLLGSFNKPLFVWSGGNSRVTRAINASDLVNLGPTPAPDRVYYRDKTRPAPHNLFTTTSEIWKLAPEGALPPVPQFTYRSPSESLPPTAVQVAGAKVLMDGSKIAWEWDPRSGLFERWLQNNRKKRLEPHHDSAGVQIGFANVVVLHVAYKRSPADRSSPEAQTVGSGDAWVLTDGHLIEARWKRSDAGLPFTITDLGGSVVAMTPGRTLVHLARKGTFVSVPVGVETATVPWPAP